MKIFLPLAVGRGDVIKPKKNKAFKRVTERAEGALKGNNSVLRGAVAKKGSGGSPIRVAAAAQEGW